MKRTSFVLAVSAIMVFAFASVALAIGPAYIAWTDGGANAGSAGTPHTDYQLTTEKCAVCHSVHAAPNGITAQPGVSDPLYGDAELLLRTPVSDACTYCHIDTAIGGKQIYDGVATNYSGAFTNDVFAHNGPPGHAECVDCHSVHGANTMAGAKEDKILKDSTERSYQDEVVTDYGGVATIDASANGDLQVTAFCTRCHKTYSTASETSITATGYWSPVFSSQTVTYKNHPLKAAEAVFTAQGSTTTTTVAWVDATYCRSCHAAGVIDGTGVITSSYPHYTPNSAYFLTAAEDAADTVTGTLSPSADGVCLRCHRDGSGAGVNLTY